MIKTEGRTLPDIENLQTQQHLSKSYQLIIPLMRVLVKHAKLKLRSMYETKRETYVNDQSLFNPLCILQKLQMIPLPKN